MSRHLYGVHYSPWTERARWALDHHELAYRYHEHVPFLGEPLLRMRGRRAGQAKATVPILVDGARAIGDSMDIIFFADDSGRGRPLAEDRDGVLAWQRIAEVGLHAGRAIVMGNLLADPAALAEIAESTTPKPIAPLLRPLAARGAKFVADKYACDLGCRDENTGVVRGALEKIRDQLGKSAYLLGASFSAADIVAAALIQGIEPMDASHLRLPKATRRAWTHPHLADEFRNLVDWRNMLYTRHRPPVLSTR